MVLNEHIRGVLMRGEERQILIRDNFGRFSARASMLNPMYPQADEALAEQARMEGKEIEPGIGTIYLTHDADKLSQYRSLRGFLGGIKRLEWGAALQAQKSLADDSLWTFPWLHEQACLLRAALDSRGNSCTRVHEIVFVKAGNAKDRRYRYVEDFPIYDLHSADALALRDFCLTNGIEIGLHASFASGSQPQLLAEEKQRLEQAWGIEVKSNRYHYLRTCHPDDMDVLAAIGIKHDFTLGFADHAGFRTGTCHSYRWKDSDLTIHPLTIMDCTLNNAQYMDLQHNEALAVCRQLVDTTHRFGGDLTLLWHNSSVAQCCEYKELYHRTLYAEILQYIATL